MSQLRHNMDAVNDHELQIGTGQGWSAWASELEGIRAQDKPLRDIVNYLIEQHDVEPAWAQVLAVYYKWNASDSGE